MLVAEDSKTIRGYLRRALQEEMGGAIIVEVADGQAALRELRGGSFDLMITDLKMPLLEGSEVLRLARLEGVFPKRGVLVLSSSLHAAMESDYSDADRVIYLRKPAVGPDILAALRRLSLLGQSKSNQG